MHIRQIKKTAATFGLIAVMTFAGFALGMTHDGSPATSGYSFGLKPDPEKAAALDGYAFQFGLLPQSGSSLVPLPKPLHRCQSLRVPNSLCARTLLLTGTKAQKIALHLLDSVLLI